MSKLYHEELMDHYRHPRNRGVLVEADIAGVDENPTCGDRVVVTAKTSGQSCRRVLFEAKGCILSQASASMLSEVCEGKNFSEILALSKESMLELVGMPLGPNRLKCALLSLYVLQEAIEKYQQRKKG